jgi:hypothetical protein
VLKAAERQGEMIRGEGKWHVFGCVVAAFNPSRSMRAGD